MTIKSEYLFGGAALLALYWYMNQHKAGGASINIPFSAGTAFSPNPPRGGAPSAQNAVDSVQAAVKTVQRYASGNFNLNDGII